MNTENPLLKSTLSTFLISIIVGTTLVGGSSQAASGREMAYGQGRSEQAPTYTGRYGRAPLINRGPVIEAQSPQNLSDRKDAAVLVGLYDAMRANGLLDPKVYPASPDVATLEKVYEDAIASKLIDPSARSPMIDIDRLQNRANGHGIVAGGVPTKALSTTCIQNLAQCGFATGGGVLACAAAAETVVGILAVCVPVLSGAGLTCNNAVTNCSAATRTEYDYLSSAAGATPLSTDVTQNATCRDNQRVDGMTAYWAAHDGTTSIRSVVIHCTDGQTWGFGGSYTGTYGTVTCSNGYLYQGLNVYPSTSWISALKARCDKVYDGTNEFIGPVWGGTANSAVIIQCPEGTYMSGLKTWRSASSTASNRYLRRIALNCRGGN